MQCGLMEDSTTQGILLCIEAMHRAEGSEAYAFENRAFGKQQAVHAHLHLFGQSLSIHILRQNVTWRALKLHR